MQSTKAVLAHRIGRKKARTERMSEILPVSSGAHLGMGVIPCGMKAGLSNVVRG